MSIKVPIYSLSVAKKGKTKIPARYIFALLSFLGFFNVFAMRVNLNVAIIAMVKESSYSSETNSQEEMACQELLPQVPYGNSSAKSHSRPTGEFDWDPQVQGMVLGAFSYGYIITQIPGGLIAEKYGAKWLYGAGMLLATIFTLLTPIAARWNVWALVAARVLEGIGTGVTFPAINTLIGQWAPKLERSRLSAFIYAGSNVGTVFTLTITGFLCDSDFFGGWPSVFYVWGASGCFWFVLWTFLVFETPESHPRIRRDELLFIRQSQDKPRLRPPTPWKSIITSIPFWALLVAHFGEIWGMNTLIIQMPMYLSNILHFDLNQNGALSALPSVLLSIVSIFASIFADKLRANGKWRTTTIRKIFNSVGFIGPAICLTAVAFLGCRPFIIVILLTLTMGLNGFAFSGFICTHVDMSPVFAGTLFGITNCISNFTGFLVPAYVGWLLQDGQTVNNWGIVFVTAAVIFLVTGVIYDIFCSAEPQPWGVGEVRTAEKKLYIKADESVGYDPIKNSSEM